MFKKIHLGDKGETSLIGKRVSKTDQNISVLGMLDELNSFIGLANSFLKDKEIKAILEKVQNDLFLLGEEVAKKDFQPPKTKFSASDIEFLEKNIDILEKNIDILEKEINPIKKFVLPGGSQEASSIHVARSVCRRCEREIVTLMGKENLDENILKYINRLSDLLFVIARIVNQRSGTEEKTWGPEGLLSI